MAPIKNDNENDNIKENNDNNNHIPSVINLADFDTGFKQFHELMRFRINEILLVSSSYDAFIMEEDGFLGEKIFHEYRGLSLSYPPKITRVSSAQEAIRELERKEFDLVITVPRLVDMSAFTLANKIRERNHDLPIILLTHSIAGIDNFAEFEEKGPIDSIFVWMGNTDIFLALIKRTEDRFNAPFDTQSAGVRVILLVEDSPTYSSSLLPIIYKEVVRQTRAIMGEGLNREHQLLKLRARPKILVATNYEEAMDIYGQYKPYLIGVLSDTSFPKEGKMDENAGLDFLRMARKEIPDLPLLLLSSESKNVSKADQVQARFLDKNIPSLHIEIRNFFLHYLGFGDFVFRMPDGHEIASAANIHALEKLLPQIPFESIRYHVNRNHFSRWLMARSEVTLASRFRHFTVSDFSNINEIRKFLIANIKALRIARQKGVVVSFDPENFDPDIDFFKIGSGSLGGKARGLAFLAKLLRSHPSLIEKFGSVKVTLPKTLVITTEGYDSFLSENHLEIFSEIETDDEDIANRFLEASFPAWIKIQLRLFLQHVTYPLAVRSSGLLEDSLFQPYAGLYKTYMLPNCNPDLEIRLEQLIKAIKLIYASVYFHGPKVYSQNTSHRIEDEKMAIIIQQLNGSKHGDYFYPDISGVAQSYNFYPISYMRPEDGIFHVALGLGKMVVEGGKVLRCSPKYPQLLPQYSNVEDILKNSQRFFYTLLLDDACELGINEDSTMVKREIADAIHEAPVQLLSSTYDPEDHYIRDTAHTTGVKVLTFAQILKYKYIPLADILNEILLISEKGMGGPVEIEFATTMTPGQEQKAEVVLLQVRPMSFSRENIEVEITTEDLERSVGYSDSALGNGRSDNLADIVYVKPEKFNPGDTINIAHQIAKINATMQKQNKKYLLIGPGRWGSSDHWLGIPISWNDISNAAGIVETTLRNFRADPSQGTHLFQNITSLGIFYLTISTQRDFIDWDWLNSLPVIQETSYIKHVHIPSFITIKADGKKSKGVIIRC